MLFNDEAADRRSAFYFSLIVERIIATGLLSANSQDLQVVHEKMHKKSNRPSHCLRWPAREDLSSMN
jgi:hypothetical protein